VGLAVVGRLVAGFFLFFVVIGVEIGLEALGFGLGGE